MDNESQRMVGWASHGSSKRKNDQPPPWVCVSVCNKIILISELFVAEKDKDSRAVNRLGVNCFTQEETLEQDYFLK